VNAILPVGVEPCAMKTFNIGGKQIQAKECPECGAEVLSLIHEFKHGKIVKTFCRFCPKTERRRP
jgi:hypothetical protein